MKEWQVVRGNDILERATSFKDGCDKLKRWLGSYTLGIQFGWRVMKVTLIPHDWSASTFGDHECAVCGGWLPGFKERPKDGCILI